MKVIVDIAHSYDSSIVHTTLASIEAAISAAESVARTCAIKMPHQSHLALRLLLALHRHFRHQNR